MLGMRRYSGCSVTKSSNSLAASLFCPMTAKAHARDAGTGVTIWAWSPNAPEICSLQASTPSPQKIVGLEIPFVTSVINSSAVQTRSSLSLTPSGLNRAVAHSSRPASSNAQTGMPESM